MSVSSLARQNLNEETEKVINRQILTELTAAYTYRSMAQWCSRDVNALHGLARYYYAEYLSELKDANRFIDYLVERGGKVQHESLPAPQSEYKSAIETLELALTMEKEVNVSLLNLSRIANQQQDHALKQFIDEKFLNQQVCAIKKAADRVAELRRAGPEGLGLYVFDKVMLKKMKKEAKELMKEEKEKVFKDMIEDLFDLED